MKFVAISDTHGRHYNLALPQGDVIIHAGDVSMKGEETEIADFLNWFRHQNFTWKILVAGNHDFYFERETQAAIEKKLTPDIIYLNDSGITINNINIWGSPVTPWFFNWAFNRHRGNPIKKHWDLIPSDTDILVTHGPAFSLLDMNNKGENIGCKDLLDKIQEIKPKMHICGHIHESYGTVEKAGIRVINASVLNERYELVNDPLTFEI